MSIQRPDSVRRATDELLLRVINVQRQTDVLEESLAEISEWNDPDDDDALLPTDAERAIDVIRRELRILEQIARGWGAT